MRNLTTTKRESLWDFMSEMERAFDGLWEPTRETKAMGKRIESFIPAVDLHETSEGYLVSADLPGMDQKDIKVDVHNGRLTIHGERSREEKSEEGQFRRYEKSYGRFERSFQLPQNVAEDKVQARFENGVLEVFVPKVEAAKPKSVEVEVGKGGLFSKLVGQKTEKKENH